MPSGLDNRLDNRGFHTHLHCAVLLLPLKAVSAPKNRNSSTHNARLAIPYFSLPCQARLTIPYFSLPCQPLLDSVLATRLKTRAIGCSTYHLHSFFLLPLVFSETLVYTPESK